MSSLGLENLVKVAVHHDRCEKIQELSENVTKLKDLMKQNLGKLTIDFELIFRRVSWTDSNHQPRPIPLDLTTVSDWNFTVFFFCSSQL